ncbi:MAG: DUF1176 domain-containing protein [Candidatus Electronema sp. VV]
MRSVNRAALLAALILIQNSSAYAISFQHKDWELVCDNTRTCRAVSHAAKSVSDRICILMSMLLERKAGQRTPIAIAFESFAMTKPGDFFNERTEYLYKSEMQIGDVSVSDFERHIKEKANVNKLLEAMSNSEEMLFSEGDRRWKLSLAGLKAVLLKMDEVQGRVGTPGALIAKGTKPEQQVLPPVPIKTLVVPRIPPTTKQDRKLFGAVADFLDSKCEGEKKSCKDSRTIERLSKDKLLVSQWDSLQGYATMGIAVFVINDALSYNPVPAVDGEKIISCEDNEEARVMKKGIIKSCGYSGGCWDTISWAWTGSVFEKADETTGCVPGGAAWELPRVISKVLNKNDKTKQ